MSKHQKTSLPPPLPPPKKRKSEAQSNSSGALFLWQRLSKCGCSRDRPILVEPILTDFEDFNLTDTVTDIENWIT